MDMDSLCADAAKDLQSNHPPGAAPDAPAIGDNMLNMSASLMDDDNPMNQAMCQR